MSSCAFPFQVYVHHSIHDIIFTFVGTLEASQVGEKPSCVRVVLVPFVHLEDSPSVVEAAGGLWWA